MTDPELNAKAARICGRPCACGFHSCTDPADCAMLMEAMEKRGWAIESDGPFGDQYSAIVYKPKAIGAAFKENERGRWRAVTAAAVAAVEGEAGRGE